MKAPFFFLCLLFINLSVDAASAYPKKVADTWAYIPSGKIKMMGQKDSTEVKGFWMQKYEVRNRDYLDFVAWVAKNGDAQKLKTALPDTMVWRGPYAYNEPYMLYYFRHPAYYDYPTVGVGYEAAKFYCAWLTEVYNARLAELFPKLDAKAVEVRLPTETEWMWAAKGGHPSAVYPWAGPFLRNPNGDLLCNFQRLGEGAFTRDMKTGKMVLVPLTPTSGYPSKYDYTDVTAPVESYWPNDYGLYNMAGNVAEMVSVAGVSKGGSWYTGGYDARIEAPDPNEGNTVPTAFIGFRPIFTVVPR